MCDNIQFVSYFTVEPNEGDINDYLEDIQIKYLHGTKHTLCF